MCHQCRLTHSENTNAELIHGPRQLCSQSKQAKKQIERVYYYNITVHQICYPVFGNLA